MRREDLALLQVEQVIGDYNLLKSELAENRKKFLNVMHNALEAEEIIHQAAEAQKHKAKS